MIKIGICEENIVTKKILAQMFSKIQFMHNMMTAEIPSNENLVTTAITINPDIILLGENLNRAKNSDMYETARQLRSNGCTAVIIFMASTPQCIHKTTCLKPSAYILKPFHYEDICQLIFESIDENLLADSIDIKHNYSKTAVDLDNIIYVEADKRYTNIRTNDKNYLSTECISKIEERLPKRFFFRTHRTYILNFKHIANIDNCLIEMDNGEFVVLSRHKKSEFDKAYSAFKKIK